MDLWTGHLRSIQRRWYARYVGFLIGITGDTKEISESDIKVTVIHRVEAILTCTNVLLVEALDREGIYVRLSPALAGFSPPRCFATMATATMTRHAGFLTCILEGTKAKSERDIQIAAILCCSIPTATTTMARSWRAWFFYAYSGEKLRATGEHDEHVGWFARKRRHFSNARLMGYGCMESLH